MKDVRIRRIDAHEQRRALRLALAARDVSPAQLDRNVTAYLEYARRLSLDAGRIWVAASGGRPVSACACLESPGRTAMLFIPDGGEAPDPRVTTSLLAHAVDQERSRDVHVVQCLSDPDDARNLSAARAAGFDELTILRYLECDLTALPAAGERLAAPGPDGSLEWTHYDAARHGELAQLILRTYEASDDCRGLAGVREIDDVIAGHMACGRFAPERWRILRTNNEAIACILLSENPLRAAAEVAYMGVVPSHRRQGIGRFVVRHGLDLAREHGFEVVTLAVDDRNAPARALYGGFGFVETARRRAMIRVLRPTPAAT